MNRGGRQEARDPRPTRGSDERDDMCTTHGASVDHLHTWAPVAAVRWWKTRRRGGGCGQARRSFRGASPKKLAEELAEEKDQKKGWPPLGGQRGATDNAPSPGGEEPVRRATTRRERWLYFVVAGQLSQRCPSSWLRGCNAPRIRLRQTAYPGVTRSRRRLLPARSLANASGGRRRERATGDALRASIDPAPQILCAKFLESRRNAERSL